MKKILLLFAFQFLFTLTSFGQCFDCAKNIGGWTDDSAIDIKKTVDGLIYLTDSNGFISSRIQKYDFNCNLVWEKNFGYHSIKVNSVSTDDQGNIYLVIHASGNYTNTNVNGFIMSTGLNLYKLNSSGVIQWSKNIGRVGYEMLHVFYYQNQVFITGTFYDRLIINNITIYDFPYTDHPRAFIAKYDTDGNYINAIGHGNGNDTFAYAEIDNQGSIYMTRSDYRGINSSLDKFDSSLQMDWSKTLSNISNTNTNGIYVPTGIRFNKENNKIYLWGRMSLTTSIAGNPFVIGTSNAEFQSALTEFNTVTGDLERFKRFNTSSLYNSSSASAYARGRSAYMEEKNGDLYILTSFRGILQFPNATVTSTQNIYSYSEDLVLFKVKMSDFSNEFLFQSQGTSGLTYMVNNMPGPITFNNDDLFVTATFCSNPIQVNNVTINNNSGNNDPDAMLYKYSINNPLNHGEIKINNTCLNELTNFELAGNFDSISWNFGDFVSPNNTSSLQNPQHLFTTSGPFHITATVTCGNNTETLEKDIFISSSPLITPIPTITECETVPESGISNNFDTSNFGNLLIGGQQNVTIEYRNSDGLLLTSPLPNPYTNTNIGGDIITARVYFSNNPSCFKETTIRLTTKQRPTTPSLTAQQQFCIQQNATLNDVLITGQNIQWYDAITGGNLLNATTLLQNGVTYYASQIINGCESTRVPVFVTIQNTPPPTGNQNQNFCFSQNATLNDIAISGNNIIWYNSSTGNSILPVSTFLADNTTYYATQTINNCESNTRFAVTTTLIRSLNANNYSETICDDLNDGIEIINLSSYNTNLISTTNSNTFSYYNSYDGAENLLNSDEITNFSNFTLNVDNYIIFVRIDSNNGCHQIVQLSLSLVKKPIIPINDIMPICEGNSITVNAGNGFDSYLWSTSDTSQSINISTPGNYSITVTKNHGSDSCTSVKNFTVTNSNSAIIQEIITSDWASNQNTISVLLTINSNGDYLYSIDGINYQTSNTFSNLTNGEYTVFVKDNNGCGTTSEEVYLLMYPHFFTPNEDGYNDTWKIEFSEIEPNLTIKIFNRFGKLLKELDSNSKGWDGTYIGQPLPSDDYWFVVKRNNGKEFKGHFALKR